MDNGKTYEKFEFSAPRPWHIEGETIRDREGGVVMSAINPANMETRSLIVRAVNERETIINAHVILSGEVRGLAAEAEKLTDLVKRLVPFVAEAEEAWRKVAATKPEDIAFTAEEDKAKLIRDAENHHAEIVSALREAREAIGEDSHA